jgi:hypothetical protein
VVLFGLVYSGRSVAAQYGQSYRITEVTSGDLSYPASVNVQGEVKGFACVSDVSGDLDKGDGDISTQRKCYVLSK